MDPRLTPAAQLSWSPDRRVLRAEGDCAGVLRASCESLVGLPLHAALGVTEELAVTLDQRARGGEGVEFVRRVEAGDGAWLRVTLGMSEGLASAGVLDLAAVLLGAPPVQISSLSSSLSHEIRNPLSSVKMAVQTLARNAGLSEKDARRLTIANREIRTMERMLSLLSEYGREVAVNLEPVALPALVQEAAALVELELTERKVEVRVEGPQDLPRVWAEPPRFRPVLAQLLLNVAIGLPPGQTLPVQVARSDAGVTLLVTDPAAALPEDEQATLFEPFGSRLARGAGLSLAALKRAMQLQRGSVAASGGAQPGTVFTLTFAPA
jgi:two-component system sensor histidine kinase HydH